MPPLDFSDYVRLTRNWDYGEEVYGQQKTSFTIGNLFLLRGPATDIREENKENWYQPNIRILDFKARSAAMAYSSDPFLDVTEWRDVHIKNRTERLVELFEKRFPRDCDPFRPE
jgi:hypothetical protein